MVRYAQKRLVVGHTTRPSEDNHPLAQCGSLLPQASIKRARRTRACAGHTGLRHSVASGAWRGCWPMLAIPAT
jgi:hypothetical protein